MNEVIRCLGCMNEIENVPTCPYCGWTSISTAESVLHLDPGSILNNKYLIGRVLGQGGFGITYLAWDLNLNIKLAIKEYLPQNMVTRVAGQSEVITYYDTLSDQFHYGLDKFLQEARTLAQFIDHPSIVSVRDYFQANGTAYLVMNYIEGVTLKEYPELIGRRISFSEARDMFMPLMDALSIIHSRGILHRDISPDNILVKNNGHLTLIDFGAARQAIGDRQHNLSIILKPGFSPEEQYRSNGVLGPWTDLYALTATLYWLITGHKPSESLDRLAEDTIMKPSMLGVNINYKEESAIMKALSVKATDRYQSISEFQNEMMSNEYNDKQENIIENKADAIAVTRGDTEKIQTAGEKVSLQRKIIYGLLAVVALLIVFVATSYNWNSRVEHDSLAIAEGELLEEDNLDETDSTIDHINPANVQESQGLIIDRESSPILVPDDFTTIQAAINSSVNGDTIIVKQGTYNENIDFMGKNITLQSTDPGDPAVVAATIIDGRGRGSTVTIRSGESRSAKLMGFTITRGTGTIAEYKITSYDNERLTFKRQYGGGILISGRSSPTIIENVIVNNSVKNINRQDLGVGGGIAILDFSSPIIENNLIINNKSEGYGGGIAVWYNSSPVLRHNVVSDNRADKIGGGILVAMMCSPLIENNEIVNNNSDRSGGIYIAHMSPATVRQNSINSNSANLGAGLFVWRTESVNITDNFFEDNTANQSGAAIYIGDRSVANVYNNQFINNSATSKGGALWISSDSRVILKVPDSNNYEGNIPDSIYYK